MCGVRCGIYKGEKSVRSSVQSDHATHSYTIQPVTSASGYVFPKMLVIYQEPGGRFGVRVVQHMLKPQNLIQVASKSGLITKQILTQFFQDVYFPYAAKESLLLVDSLGTYRDRTHIDAIRPQNMVYTVKTIPPGCTPYIQPLDVLFFRQFKAVLKRIEDHSILNDYQFTPSSRDSISLLISSVLQSSQTLFGTPGL